MVKSLTCFLLAFAIHAAAAAVSANQTVRLESGVAQLFIDDEVIESQNGLKRILHQPNKDHGGNTPVLALDAEFNGQPATLQANATIVFDPQIKKYVMFGMGYCSSFAGPPEDKVRIFRFTSPDGMNWIKGDDGKPQHIRFDLTDAVSGTRAKNTDLFSYYYDLKDAAYPYKGWLFFSNWAGGREGTYYVRSHDGISWERVRQVIVSRSRKIVHDGRTFQGPGDVTIFYHDPVADRFIASLRFFTLDGAGPDKKSLLRAKAYLPLERMDEPFDLNRVEKLELVPAGIEANGDLPSDEYYSATTWRYESLWLGGLKVWHGSGDYPYSPAGSAFLKLAVSHDGLHWEKVRYMNDAGQPEVFIPNGPEGGNNHQNDGGYITEFSNAPLRIGDELIYYYGCSSYGKNHPANIRVSGGGIFRARLRPDGFVSVTGGTLTTKPMQCPGKNLQINSVGPVNVEVLGQGGKVLDSATLSGDSLRHPVIFGDKTLGETLGGDAQMQLRFAVGDGGRLYSFTVR